MEESDAVVYLVILKNLWSIKQALIYRLEGRRRQMLLID
jgi:hypothetical protein